MSVADMGAALKKEIIILQKNSAHHMDEPSSIGMRMDHPLILQRQTCAPSISWSVLDAEYLQPGAFLWQRSIQRGNQSPHRGPYRGIPEFDWSPEHTPGCLGQGAMCGNQCRPDSNRHCCQQGAVLWLLPGEADCTFT